MCATATVTVTKNMIDKKTYRKHKEWNMSIDKTKQTSKRMFTNAEDILNAVAISTTVAFTGFQAYMHRGNGIQWILLGAASAWCLFQAAKAWSKVLNK